MAFAPQAILFMTHALVFQEIVKRSYVIQAHWKTALVLTLNLTEPLPAHWPIPNPISAWEFELVDGTNCSYLGGATAAFGGKRVNYSCTDGWYVLGIYKRVKSG